MSEKEKESEKEALTLIEEMQNRRTVVLGDEINEESVRRVGKQLLTLQAKSDEEITILINSNGGGINEALLLCDFITYLLKAPVRGVAMGRCSSAATFVLLNCKKRLATPNARFLIHSGTIGKISLRMNDASSENLEHILKEVRATEEAVIKMYMQKLTPTAWAKKRTAEKQKREFVKNLIKRGDQNFDNYLSADEAVEIGLITSIINEKLGIF